MSERGRPRRPGVLRGEQPDPSDAGGDPAQRWEVAYRTAAALIAHGRDSTAEDVARLVSLTDELGIEEVAQLWSSCPGDSLPGALWRLYLVRAGIRANPALAARYFALGREHADVDSVVAGVEDPWGPQEVIHVADAILRGAFSGDLAVALDRAGAYCRIVATGMAIASENMPEGRSALIKRASAMRGTSDELAAAAAAGHRGTLLDVPDALDD